MREKSENENETGEMGELRMICCHILFLSLSLSLSLSVIGRGGEMITRLQGESGAKIQVAPGDLIPMYSINII